MHVRSFIFGANWKMAIGKRSDAVKTAQELLAALLPLDLTGIDIIIAPSFTALDAVGSVIKGSKLKLAAQNMYFRDSGAFTGEISADSLLDLGCQYVILGHSERRRIFNESSAVVNQKAKKALEKGLRPIIALGETAKERAAGQTDIVIRTQLTESLADIPREQLSKIILAYEPVWAINNKFLNPDTEIKTATPQEATVAHNLIRSWLVSQYAEIGKKIPIQYGVSLTAETASGILAIPEVNGGLVGSASLSVAQFLPIIESAIHLRGN